MPGVPSDTAVKGLYAMSRNLCMYRGCEEKLTDPDWPQVKGRICHIKGNKPGSARYDPNQSEEERQGYYNLILLCPNHHVKIDSLEPDKHSVEMLNEMREQAAAAGQAVTWASDADLTRYTALTLAVFVYDNRPESGGMPQVTRPYSPASGPQSAPSTSRISRGP